MKLHPETLEKYLAAGATLGPVAKLDCTQKVYGDDAAGISEKQFMADVVRYAKAEGHKVYHTHDSRKSEAGFCDLVLVREIVIFAELKTEKGKLTAAQSNWIEALTLAGAKVYEWRPSDWPQIISILIRKDRP